MRRRGPGALAAAFLWAAALPASADVPIPPAPVRQFDDRAGLVDAGTAARLDAKLSQFRQETSIHLVVVIFPELPSSSLEDFTVRAAQAWRTGEKKLDNGAVLFVFAKEHKTRVEVGYGLEGALPDATVKQILADVLVPHFRNGDYGGGLEAAIDAMMAATRGEFHGAPRRRRGGIPPDMLVFLILAFIFVVLPLLTRSGSRTYSRGGWGGGPWWWGGGGFGGGGGSGGGWGGGGGGGYSGGGGSFGGGGASADW